MDNCDVAIVGAGPYGLSTASYLQQIKGLEVRLFGRPMDFWERCMPPQMLLRSHWDATHIADPKNRMSLDAYVSATGSSHLGEPIPVSDFIDYGRWFGSYGELGADQRNVTRLSASASRFKLTLEDGSVLQAKHVVVATGIERFAYKPPIFNDIPSELASHSSELRGYAAFKGKAVAIIGGGQSALEAGAFLHANGAQVEIFVRQRRLGSQRGRFSWLGNPPWLNLLRGRGDVGPAGISLIIQRPWLFSRFPRRLQSKWDRRAIKLGFSYRLAPELNSGLIRSGIIVDQVEIEGQRLRLGLSDGSERVVDYAILATGYRIDVAQCPFWGRGIIDNLALIDGYPRLDSALESSVPGLHFVGAMAAHRFGPLMRFVSGTGYAASSITGRIRSQAKQHARHRIATQTPEVPHAARTASQNFFSPRKFSRYESIPAQRPGERAD